MTKATALSLLLLLAPGCAAFRSLGEGEGVVQVAQVGLALNEETRADLAFTLRVRNDEAEPVTVSSLSFSLELDGRPFAAGVQTLDAQVDPGTTREVGVAMPLSFRRRVLSTEPRDVQLALAGKVELTLGRSSLWTRFDALKTVKLARAPVWSIDEE